MRLQANLDGLRFPFLPEELDFLVHEPSKMLNRVQKYRTSYGRARRIWVMDRGIPTEAVLAEMRSSEREILERVIPMR